MRWYVNDLSVQGQFGTSSQFIESLRGLLKLRANEQFRKQLYCSRDGFRKRPICADVTVADAIRACSDRDFKNVTLSWLDKFGPFLEDDRLEEQDDLFWFETHDVTDQGLGEAARRNKAGEQAGTFSFVGGPLDFERENLDVQQGLLEAVLAVYPVENVWDCDGLFKKAVQDSGINSWNELVEECSRRFDKINFGNDIEGQLSREPFNRNLLKNILDILDVLQEIMFHRRADGRLTDRGTEILQTYFVGKNAWFSDESDQNKEKFYDAMSFSDPDDPRRKVTCFWHGKIQTPQFRVHFEWPVPVGQDRLKVLYIGPKISKR